MNNAHITDETSHTLHDFALIEWCLDKVAEQGERAAGFGGCKYRYHPKEGGTLKCAVGHCIPDRQYSLNVEGGTLFAIGHMCKPKLRKSKKMDRVLEGRFDLRQLQMLCFAQAVHDNSSSFEVFLEKLKELKDMNQFLRESLIIRISLNHIATARSFLTTPQEDVL